VKEEGASKLGRKLTADPVRVRSLGVENGTGLAQSSDAEFHEGLIKMGYLHLFTI
jgi:hypothetical protein